MLFSDIFCVFHFVHNFCNSSLCSILQKTCHSKCLIFWEERKFSYFNTSELKKIASKATLHILDLQNSSSPPFGCEMREQILSNNSHHVGSRLYPGTAVRAKTFWLFSWPDVVLSSFLLKKNVLYLNHEPSFE